LNPSIRAFTTDDYEDVLAVSNRSYPDYPDTVDEWRYWDEHRAPKIKFQRYVAEVDGEVAGLAQYNQAEGMYHPRKFGLDVTVDPDYRRRGIGSRLYDHVMAELEPHDPITLMASAREDYVDGVSFLEHRGYHEVMRNWENRLDLTQFDAEQWSDRVESVQGDGIRLSTMAELQTDPDCLRKLHELDVTIARDVPAPEPRTPLDYDLWREKIATNPNLMPELWFVALDGDKYVAMSNMWASQASKDELYTGLTGTLREYRRRGIATALKVACLKAAHDKGYALTKTWNETGNEGMLAINEALGFVRQPAWINYSNELKTE